MARILNMADAFAYLRMCDGGEDFDKALLMIGAEYEGMRERYHALRAGFADEVETAFDNKLRAKDQEITRLREMVRLAALQHNKVRDALCYTPEDEDDT